MFTCPPEMFAANQARSETKKRKFVAQKTIRFVAKAFRHAAKKSIEYPGVAEISFHSLLYLSLVAIVTTFVFSMRVVCVMSACNLCMCQYFHVIIKCVVTNKNVSIRTT